MAKLKLQQEVLEQLEAQGWLEFTAAQRSLTSAIKSGQNYYFFGGSAIEDLRKAIVATIVHKLKASFEDVARALILVPNSDLAEEYAELFKILGKHTDLRVWTAYEGPKILTQKENIYFGADVVIATPKRLNELLNIEGFNSASVQTLILDQADALLKVGTTGFTQRISDSIPEKQRIALTAEENGSVKTYMAKHAYPYTKSVLE